MNLLYLVIVFPLISCLLLIFSNNRLSKNIISIIGVGSVSLSMLTTFWIALDFFCRSNTGTTIVFHQILWHWVNIYNFDIPLALYLDGLSLTMLLVITVIGFLIHVYASWYMYNQIGYSRFFGYTNLFISSMSLVVLADNLLLMYIGWEVIGFCSYLLINFYYKNKNNGIYAIKAFVITRISDVFLTIAFFVLYNYCGTLNFHELTILAPIKLGNNSFIATLITLMLLGGAVGKSAQFPLHTWLADAMVAPTPVSALIHAATMVTAGVYLIARTHILFLMTPSVLYLVSILGAITMMIAGLSALVQTNIKKILAYSTMSQVGYMFLALGVKAWDAAIFHLMTHACFKALLFLSAGSVIYACNEEQNIFKMGGLNKSMPLVYTCFLVGGSALSSLPLLTASFYSKDEIIWGAILTHHYILAFIALICVCLTSFYTFRMIFIVFHGKLTIKIKKILSLSHNFSLIILLILSTFVLSWITLPLKNVFPYHGYFHKGKLLLKYVSSVLTFISISISYLLWIGDRKLINIISNSTYGGFLKFLCIYSWGIDWLYNKIFIKCYIIIAKIIKNDPLNTIVNSFGFLAKITGNILTISENGQLRWYMTSIGIGTLLLLIFLLLL